MSRPLELSNTNRIQVVVLVLENNQGDLLLTQRKKHQHLAGYWEFPGGKVEKHETFIAALQRECKEEIDFEIKNPSHILQVNYNYPSKHIELQVFHEISENPHVMSAENQPIRWVKKSDLADYKLPEANTSIVQYINTHLV